jgi:hypothetical protein
MDAQLAEIYGTGVSAEDDQVKLAAAELLVKLAEDNQVDLSQFSDAEVAQMVSELHKQAEFPPAMEEKKEEKKESKETPESKESSESSESAEKAAAEKVAEADFLGRVMAHSFNQELTEINKEAGVKDKAISAGKSIGEFFKNRGKNVANAAKATGAAAAKGGAAVGRAGKAVGSTAATAGKAVNEQVKKHPWAAAGAAGALGAAGGAAAMHKKSSALDALASERAWELAKEAGWVDAEGNLVVPQQAEEQKVASALEIEVERRALQMLEAEGLPVKWNE